MKVEIPPDIEALISRSYPAILATKIPKGENFDGDAEELQTRGTAMVRWCYGIGLGGQQLPAGALCFRFTACSNQDGQVQWFNDYFAGCERRNNSHECGIPIAHIILHIPGPDGSEGWVGDCDGLPTFRKYDQFGWVLEDSLQWLRWSRGGIDDKQNVQSLCTSWDPNIHKLADYLGKNFDLSGNSFGKVKIGIANLTNDLASKLLFIPANSAGAHKPVPTQGDTEVLKEFYRLDAEFLPSTLKLPDCEIASSLFAALSFASGLRLGFAATVVVQGGCPIFRELRPCRGGVTEALCAPTGEDGNAVKKIAWLFLQRLAADLSQLSRNDPHFMCTHPLVGAIQRINEALSRRGVEHGDDLYLTLERACLLISVAIEAVSRCYEPNETGVTWRPTREKGDARVERWIGSKAYGLWARYRHALAHRLKLIENDAPSASRPGARGQGAAALSDVVRAFLERGSEINGRLRDLWTYERFLMTAFNHLVLRVIGYDGKATDWMDKPVSLYQINGGNAPAPELNSLNRTFSSADQPRDSTEAEGQP